MAEPATPPQHINGDVIIAVSQHVKVSNQHRENRAFPRSREKLYRVDDVFRGSGRGDIKTVQNVTNNAGT